MSDQEEEVTFSDSDLGETYNIYDDEEETDIKSDESTQDENSIYDMFDNDEEEYPVLQRDNSVMLNKVNQDDNEEEIDIKNEKFYEDETLNNDILDHDEELPVLQRHDTPMSNEVNQDDEEEEEYPDDFEDEEVEEKNHEDNNTEIIPVEENKDHINNTDFEEIEEDIQIEDDEEQVANYNNGSIHHTPENLHRVYSSSTKSLPKIHNPYIRRSSYISKAQTSKNAYSHNEELIGGSVHNNHNEELIGGPVSHRKELIGGPVSHHKELTNGPASHQEEVLIGGPISCSEEVKNNINAVFNSLMTDNIMHSTVIFKENVVGCHISLEASNQVTVDLSFDNQVCTFIIYTKEREIDLVNGEDLATHKVCKLHLTKKSIEKFTKSQ